MNKSDFIDLVQETGEMGTKAEASRAVNAFIESVTKALKKGESVQLIGFGTFMAVDVPEKTGLIPNSKKKYTKPAHKAPKFKAGKGLKESLL